MTIGKTTLYVVIAIMLATGPVVAKARKATNGTNSEPTCVQQMTQSRTEGEGRSHAKFQEQVLSECLTQQGK